MKYFLLVLLFTACSSAEKVIATGKVHYKKARTKQLTLARRNKAIKQVRYECKTYDHRIIKEERAGSSMVIHYACIE